MTFYGGLGLPLLLAPPLGHHERLNREWALSLGVARDACAADSALCAVLGGVADGSLARCALNGFQRMEQRGAARILAGDCAL
jgi:hypothetical protein